LVSAGGNDEVLRRQRGCTLPRGRGARQGLWLGGPLKLDQIGGLQGELVFLLSQRDSSTVTQLLHDFPPDAAFIPARTSILHALEGLRRRGVVTRTAHTGKGYQYQLARPLDDILEEAVVVLLRGPFGGDVARLKKLVEKLTSTTPS